MDWNYFKIRRRTTLERFLSGVSSESEALEFLKKKGLRNLPLDEIKQLFAPKPTVSEEERVVQVLDSPEQQLNVNPPEQQLGVNPPERRLGVKVPSPAKKVKATNGSVGN